MLNFTEGLLVDLVHIKSGAGSMAYIASLDA